MAPPKILIVGQGLAGTVLGWSLTRAGIDWRMMDAGHAAAASRVAAGIINPVTGQRWVKTWRIEELWEETRRFYQDIEQGLGVPLWRELKIRRYWRTARELRILNTKRASGVLAPFVESVDERSCVIAPAARVDVPAMLNAARQRWIAEGRLTEARLDWADLTSETALVIDCTGAAIRGGCFAAGSWAVSKGEVLRVAVPERDPGLIEHRGHWLLPVPGGDAWVGATHEPGIDDLSLTAAAWESLLASAERLTGQRCRVADHLAGLWFVARDMRPVVGRHPEHPQRGVFGALGGKGVLYAPWLARQWTEHLGQGTEFDAAVSILRLEAGFVQGERV